jgi:hemerythrin
MIQWHPDLSVHSGQIDAQHRHMFALTNELVAATDPTTIRALLMQLYKHTREHFALEEDHMRGVGYPQLAEHVASHNQLLSGLNEVSAEVGRGKIDKAAIEHMVLNWTSRHTGHDDALFARYLESHLD